MPSASSVLSVMFSLTYVFFWTNIFVLREWKRGTIQVQKRYKSTPSKASKLKSSQALQKNKLTSA